MSQDQVSLIIWLSISMIMNIQL